MNTHPTLIDLLPVLAQAGKPVSKRTLQRYLADLNIRPVGAAQRPQRYPMDTAVRVLSRLGLVMSGTEHAARLPKDRLLTLPEIKRAAKRKGGK